MTLPTLPNPAPDVAGTLVSEEPMYRFSVAQYHDMIGKGILGPHDPVELLEGWVVEKMPKSPPHDVAVGLAGDAVAAILPGRWHVRTKGTVTTADSEPEPDVAVVRGKRRDYNGHHPSPADSALLIEVANTSLTRDRTLKLRVYTRAGVGAYWIVNLSARVVEVHADPHASPEPASYARTLRFGLGDHIPVVIDGNEVGRVAVADLLP
jgi:Uma2 family endonuclease